MNKNEQIDQAELDQALAEFYKEGNLKNFEDLTQAIREYADAANWPLDNPFALMFKIVEFQKEVMAEIIKKRTISELKNTPWRIEAKPNDKDGWYVLDSKDYYVSEYRTKEESKIIANLPETLKELEEAQDRIKRLEGGIAHQQYRWLNTPFRLPKASDLKAMRKKRWLSMGEVQKACGVSKSTISRIEKGKNADFSTVKKLVEYYQSLPLEK